MTALTLRQFRYFEALARHRRFGHAAEACAISQPALSAQIAKLEESLGQRLVERDPRQIRLTAFGEEMILRVRAILAAVDELDDVAQAARHGGPGRLRLGMIPTIAPYLLPALLARLNQSHPGLDIHVRETLTSRLIGELHEGRIDAAVVALPIDDPGLVEVALFDEPLLLVRPVDQADRPVPGAAQMAEIRLHLLEEGHCFRDQALSFCNIGAGGRGRGLDGSSLSTLVQMVGAGIGATLIPQMAVCVEVKSAAVVAHRFPAPEPMRRVGMIWRKSTSLEDHLRTLAEAVRQTADGIAESAAC